MDTSGRAVDGCNRPASKLLVDHENFVRGKSSPTYTVSYPKLCSDVNGVFWKVLFLNVRRQELAPQTHTTDSMCMQSSHDIHGDSMRTRSVHHAGHLLDADVMATAAEEPDIIAVRTAAALQAAIMYGAQDVVIQEHVDLTDLNLAFHGNSRPPSTVLGDVNASTRSIRVLTLAFACVHVRIKCFTYAAVSLAAVRKRAQSRGCILLLAHGQAVTPAEVVTCVALLLEAMPGLCCCLRVTPAVLCQIMHGVMVHSPAHNGYG